MGLGEGIGHGDGDKGDLVVYKIGHKIVYKKDTR